MKKKLLSALLVASMLISLLAGCSGGGDPTPTPAGDDPSPTGEVLEPIDMTIGIGYHLGCALFFIADQAGYFDEYGLNVELVPFDSTATALAAMRNGELDCADFGSTGALSLIAQGADDLRIFGGQMHEGSGIVCLPENVERFSDFANYKGARLALIPMSTGDVVYRYGLAQAGLTYGTEGEVDVTIVEVDSPATAIEAIKNGEVDCAGLYMPHLANSVAQGLAIAMRSGEVIPNHP